MNDLLETLNRQIGECRNVALIDGVVKPRLRTCITAEAWDALMKQFRVSGFFYEDPTVTEQSYMDSLVTVVPGTDVWFSTRCENNP